MEWLTAAVSATISENFTAAATQDSPPEGVQSVATSGCRRLHVSMSPEEVSHLLRLVVRILFGDIRRSALSIGTLSSRRRSEDDMLIGEISPPRYPFTTCRGQFVGPLSRQNSRTFPRGSKPCSSTHIHRFGNYIWPLCLHIHHPQKTRRRTLVKFDDPRTT